MTINPIFERKAHPYYMWEGILNIPDGMREMFTPQISALIRESSAQLIKTKPLYVLGCGSSYFAAKIVAQAVQQLAGLPVYGIEAFEFLAYPPPGFDQSGLISISHSGETGPLVEAVEMAKKGGATAIAYTDKAGSSLAQKSDWAVLSQMGLEPTLPKTRSVYSAILRGYLQAIELARLNGKAVSSFENALQKAPDLIQKLIQSQPDEVESLAARWSGCRRIIIAGGGAQYGAALEGVLKMTEVARHDSAAWEIEEAAHGAWAGVTQEDLIILLAIDGPSYSSCLRLARGIKALGAQVWVITNRPWKDAQVDFVTLLPSEEAEWIMPFYTLIPLYLFSYYLALNKNLSPDNMGTDDPFMQQARGLLRSEYQPK